MPFTYCTQCGYKNVYTTRQAKFCAGCGDSLVESQTNNVSHANTKEVVEVDFQEKSFSNISKLEYDIDAPSKNFTIGDLINTKQEGGERIARKAKASESSPSLTKDELEAESMRICGSSIQNKSTE
jgi:hypothetical protein